MRILIVLLLALAPRIAAAENWLVGPVIGIHLDHGRGLVLGAEGGYGAGPERVNVGFERRLDKTFVYAEFDPWLVVGASLGWGIDTDGEDHPVLGAWEGILISNTNTLFDLPLCGDSGWRKLGTIALGYRYTGVHSLYVTVKAGASNDSGPCLSGG